MPTRDEKEQVASTTIGKTPAKAAIFAINKAKATRTGEQKMAVIKRAHQMLSSK